MERRVCHGNLNNKTLNEVLNKEIMLFNKDNIDVCKDCEFRYACHECRPDSYSGNIFEKPYYCTYNVYSGEWENLEECINKQIELMNNVK